MELLGYLKKNYRPGELIFLKDIPLWKKDNLRQQRKGLCDEGKILRYRPGVFLLPRKDRGYLSILPSHEVYLYSCYVFRHGMHLGYYSAKDQLSRAGLLPRQKETFVYTNEVKTKKKEGCFLFFPAKTKVDLMNYGVLSFLELLSHLEEFSLPYKKTMDFLKGEIKKKGIRRKDRRLYSSFFPLTLYKAVFDYSLFPYLH